MAQVDLKRVIAKAKQRLKEKDAAAAAKAEKSPLPGGAEDPEVLEAEEKEVAALMEYMGSPEYRQAITGRDKSGFNTNDAIIDLKENTPDNDNYDPTNIFNPVVKVYSLDNNELCRYHTTTEVEALNALKELNDTAFFAGHVLAFRTGHRYQDVFRKTQAFKHLQYRLKRDQNLQKALYTSGSGAGAEWIPTGFSSMLAEKINLELRIWNQFRTVNMPTNPYKLPIDSGDAVGYYISESTSDNAARFPTTNTSTGNFEFSAKKIGARSLFSEEINEDSIIGMIDIVRNKIADAIARAIENAILNGDTSASHQDSGVTSANDARKAFTGHRYWALNNAGTAKLDFSGTISADKMNQLRELMGKYGVFPSNLFYAVSPKSYIKILRLTEVRTTDKYRDNATILTGQIGDLEQIPILVSEFVQEGVNTSGLIDATPANNTKTVIHLIDKRGFWNGLRRGVTVESFRNRETDQMVVVGKIRVHHKDVYGATSASQIQTVLGHNITV